jgi:hypothetical protein
MTTPRTPFLTGALGAVFGDGDAARCEICTFDYGMPLSSALDAIEASPGHHAALLNRRDGMAPAADGGWNATAYLWHLTDLARSWSERWVQIRAEPGSVLVGWDPDELAEARNYRELPTRAAIWALRDAVDTFVALGRALDGTTTFEHGEWGTGSVEDATRWIAHEFVHHQLDVDERAR